MKKTSLFYATFLINSLISPMLLAENTAIIANPPIKIITPYSMEQYNREINWIYKQVDNPAAPTALRIDRISHHFLDELYLGGALGEGPAAKFDQQPLYRTDAFDCETLVDTVIALATANNLTNFQKTIKQIRYSNADVNYFKRNHFTSIDWNINNEKNGFLKNITPGFKGYKTLITIIDKPAWYLNHNINNLQLLSPISSQQMQQLVSEFHAYAKEAAPQESHLDYLPLTVLFSADGKPNQQLLNQIPSGSVIEIVRNEKAIDKKVNGTALDISHMGLAIHTPKGVMFREASSIEHAVIDISLADYLAQYYQMGNKTNVVGIHIEQIL